MAAARKLQAEADKLIKTVDEHSELFDEAYNSVMDRDEIEDGMRSKLEEKMKNEFKKLTRLREAVKKMFDKGLKDESKLTDARHKTEARMEQWKDYEQDKKCKPYGSRGLARGSTNERSDEIREMENQINQWQEQLEQQAESFDCEEEQILAKKVQD